VNKPARPEQAGESYPSPLGLVALKGDSRRRKPK